MDSKESLELTARDGQAVKTTINTPGWQNVIKPAFDGKLKTVFEGIRQATTYEQFVTLQQSINAIKALFEFVEVVLIEGDKALEDLGIKPDDPDEGI